MLKRFWSFLGSENKLTLYRYFQKEVKSDIKAVCSRAVSLFNGNHKQYSGKLNFSGQIDSSFGDHRNVWNSSRNLGSLHNPNGTLTDLFIERTFAWNPRGIKPHTQPWIGFIHVPPYVPAWFPQNQTNDEIFKSATWKKSYPLCKGLFTFSEYHKNSLERKLDLPIVSLFHPTEFPELSWSWDRFNKNQEKKIIQIGWWLRRLSSIYMLPSTRYRKVFLRKDETGLEKILATEFEQDYGTRSPEPGLLSETQIMNFVSNAKYDLLLAENIVFMELYDASANNAIVECIARNTPILVNPIPPVTEYLGQDYPLYFNSLEEAAMKAENMELILKAHLYLKDHPFKYKFTGDYFRESIVNSEIYHSL
jgi:hypothetical protein